MANTKNVAKKRNLGWGFNSTLKTAEFSCGGCSWKITFSDWPKNHIGPTPEVRAKFDAHNCGDYPKKRSQDFSQAAARIVREATEGR